MNKVGWIILTMMSVAVLAIAGFLPSILILIAFLALLTLWQSLIKLFPAESKFIGHALATILLISLGYNLFDAYIIPKFPMLQTAAKRAQIATDLELSLKANPLMLKSRVEIANHLQWMQDRVGEIHGFRLADIRNRFDRGLISAQQAQNETLQVLEEIKRLKKSFADSSDNYFWLIVFGIALLSLSLVLQLFIPKFALPGKNFWATVGMLLIISGFALTFSPGIKDFFSRFEFPSAPPAKTDKPPPLKPPKPKPLPYRPPTPQPPTPELRIPGHLPVALRQGIAEVAYKHNSPQQFVDQMFAGRSKQSSISNYSVRFFWVVDNEGFPRQTYQPGQLKGWKHYANIGSRQVVFFYPADNSFYFGITDG